MTKVKTYWDEIKNDEVCFYGGDYGWVVPLRYEERWEFNKTKGEIKRKTLKLQFPYFDKSVPVSERKKCREDIKYQVKKRRELAKASLNHTEYRDLQSRIYNIREEEFNNLLKSGLKGFNLRDYIIRNYLTDGEAYSLFYRM